MECASTPLNFKVYLFGPSLILHCFGVVLCIACRCQALEVCRREPPSYLAQVRFSLHAQHQAGVDKSMCCHCWILVAPRHLTSATRCHVPVLLFAAVYSAAFAGKRLSLMVLSVVTFGSMPSSHGHQHSSGFWTHGLLFSRLRISGPWQESNLAVQ